MRDRSISSVAGGLLAGLLTVLALASPAPAPAQPVPPGRSIAWQSVDPPGTRVTGLAVSGGTPQVVYASTRVEVLRSDDGGTGWRILPGSPGVDAVAVHPETAEIVLVGSGSGGLRARGVFRSTDGGATWERTLSNPTGILRVAPTDPSVVYALGVSGLVRSFDGGLSWEPFGGVFLPESLAVDPSDPATIYVGTTTRLFRSTDSGDTFEERDEGLRGSFLTIVAVGTSDPEVLYAGTRDGVFRSLDAGASWVSANGAEDAGDEGGVRVTGEVVALAVDPRDAETVLAATSSAVFRTTDGGDTWEDLLDGRFRGLQDLVADPQEPQRLIAGTVLGTFLSVDAGESWSFTLDEISGRGASQRRRRSGARPLRHRLAARAARFVPAGPRRTGTLHALVEDHGPYPARISAPRGAPSAGMSLLPGSPGRWPPGPAVPACGQAPRAVSWP